MSAEPSPAPESAAAPPPADVIYHGRQTAGGGLVTVEDGQGFPSVLRHLVRHSPAGLNWGYGGSGPADLARSLLVDACGDDARCPECAGTGKVVWCGTVGEPEVRPYDPLLPVDDTASVDRCTHCDEGYRIAPSDYQAYKFAVIAALPDEWRLTRAEVLDWWAAHSRSARP